MDPLTDDLTGQLAARLRESTDHGERAALREQLAEAMWAPMSGAARRIARHHRFDADEVLAVGMETYCKVLDACLRNYDTTKGTSFAAFVLGNVSPHARKTPWHSDTLAVLYSDRYQGTEFQYAQRTTVHRWKEMVSLDAHASLDQLEEQMLEEARGRVLRKRPELAQDAGGLDVAARRDYSQSKYAAAVRNIPNLLAIDLGRNAVRPDDADDLGWESLPASVAQQPAPLVADGDWFRLLTFGIDRRSLGRATKNLDLVADGEGALDAGVRDLAAANLTNPVTQFVVLSGVANQFDTTPPARTDRELHLLVTAACQ